MEKVQSFQSLVPKLVREILSQQGNSILLVKGTSMYPYLREGDHVWVHVIDWEKIRIGDLVAFEQNQIIFTHRVINKNATSLLTKGDNLFYPDLPVASGRLLGKVLSIERDEYRYTIEGKLVLMNRLLGFLHGYIGQAGYFLRPIEDKLSERWKKPIHWLEKIIFLPVRVLERLLCHVIQFSN